MIFSLFKRSSLLKFSTCHCKSYVMICEILWSEQTSIFLHVKVTQTVSSIESSAHESFVECVHDDKCHPNHRLRCGQYCVDSSLVAWIYWNRHVRNGPINFTVIKTVGHRSTSAVWKFCPQNGHLCSWNLKNLHCYNQTCIVSKHGTRLGIF